MAASDERLKIKGAASDGRLKIKGAASNEKLKKTKDLRLMARFPHQSQRFLVKRNCKGQRKTYFPALSYFYQSVIEVT